MRAASTNACWTVQPAGHSRIATKKMKVPVSANAGTLRRVTMRRTSKVNRQQLKGNWRWPGGNQRRLEDNLIGPLDRHLMYTKRKKINCECCEGPLNGVVIARGDCKLSMRRWGANAVVVCGRTHAWVLALRSCTIQLVQQGTQAPTPQPITILQQKGSVHQW